MTKSIVEKLNLTKYGNVAILNRPEETDYFSGLSDYDTYLKERKKYDLLFVFVVDIDSFKKELKNIMNSDCLEKGAYIYFAYPKKGNKVYATFIHRDELFVGLGVNPETGYVEESSIKFSRMVGLDEVFTVVGLKEDTNGTKNPVKSTSQRVDDYIKYIENIEKDLLDSPKLLAFYQNLTPGYKKDWARFVYSAKQESTRENRRKEMKMILHAGYKTRELFRKDNR